MPDWRSFVSAAAAPEMAALPMCRVPLRSINTADNLQAKVRGCETGAGRGECAGGQAGRWCGVVKDGMVWGGVRRHCHSRISDH
jgi:hypothetical protein